MAAIDNAARLRRYIEEIDPRGDVDALPEYVQEDVALPADTTPRGRQGLAGLREHLEFLHERVRYSSTVEDLVADGDKVAARVTVRGRLIREFMGLPANGKEFAVEEFLLAQFRDGKIGRVWRVVDLATLMQQLGDGSEAQPASLTDGRSPTDLRAAALRFAEATSAGDYGAFEDLVAPDISLPAHPPWNGASGAEALKRGMQSLHDALSNFSVTVDEVVVEGDVAVVLQTVHATHSGDLPGLPATGRDFTIQEVTIGRYRDGRMVEIRSLVDRLSMMQQVGLVPAG